MNYRGYIIQGVSVVYEMSLAEPKDRERNIKNIHRYELGHLEHWV